MPRRAWYSIFFIAVFPVAMSFVAPPGQTRLTIRFKNYVKNNPLVFDSVCYKNELGQSYTVSMFKYYVGNFSLKNIRGKEFISKGCFLINQEDTNSMQVIINNIPGGIYSSIQFTLGVDSIDNCSGAQSGALDPVNGMFWAWNSGYIFLKMEGISPASNSTGKRLEYHIGGYKVPNNCVRKINLQFENGGIAVEKNVVIDIKADVSRLFASPNTIDFSKLSSVTDFHHATNIADNYSCMFSVMNNGK